MLGHRPKMDFLRARAMRPPVNRIGCCWTKTRLSHTAHTVRPAQPFSSRPFRPTVFVPPLWSNTFRPALVVAAWTRERSASSDHVLKGNEVPKPASSRRPNPRLRAMGSVRSPPSRWQISNWSWAMLPGADLTPKQVSIRRPRDRSQRGAQLARVRPTSNMANKTT